MSDGSSAASVLFGLDEFEVLDAIETDDVVIEVEVRVPGQRPRAQTMGAFTSRVKQYLNPAGGGRSVV